MGTSDLKAAASSQQGDNSRKCHPWCFLWDSEVAQLDSLPSLTTVTADTTTGLGLCKSFKFQELPMVCEFPLLPGSQPCFPPTGSFTQSEERNVQQLHIRNNSMYQNWGSDPGCQASGESPCPWMSSSPSSGTRPAGCSCRESYWHRHSVNLHSNESQNLMGNLASA